MYRRIQGVCALLGRCAALSLVPLGLQFSFTLWPHHDDRSLALVFVTGNLVGAPFRLGFPQGTFLLGAFWCVTALIFLNTNDSSIRLMRPFEGSSVTLPEVWTFPVYFFKSSWILRVCFLPLRYWRKESELENWAKAAFRKGRREPFMHQG